MAVLTGPRAGARPLTFAVAVLATCLGCGDALEGPGYAGEPRFVIGLEVVSLSEGVRGAPTYAGIVWGAFDRSGATAAVQVAEVAAASFPTAFRLTLLDLPPGMPRDGVSVGQIVVFDDGDGNGKLPDFQAALLNHTPDRIRALAGVVVVHTANVTVHTNGYPGLSKRVLNPQALTPGFHLAVGVCAPEPARADTLMLVPAGDVAVVSVESYNLALSSRKLCLDLH